MNATKQARIFLILSMVIFGTLAPFVRKIAVSSGELALYRAILAALLIGIYLFLTKQKISFQSGKKELIPDLDGPSHKECRGNGADIHRLQPVQYT